MELEDKIIKNNPGGGIMFDKNQYPRNEIGKKIIQVLVEQSETELKNFLQYAEIKTPAVETLFQLIENSNNGKLEIPTKITSSSCGVLVVIFNNFVIKIFQTQNICEKVVRILKGTQNCLFTVNLFQYVSIQDSEVHTSFKLVNVEVKNTFFHAISTAKLNPLVKHTPTVSYLNINFSNSPALIYKLFKEIGLAMENIRQLGYNQGDCTFDNVGIIDDRFVLFDFNAANRRIQSSNNDACDFIKSAKYHLKNIGNEEISKFLNWIQYTNNPEVFYQDVKNYCAEEHNLNI
tara:strand:+ start:112 stop:981 length:870 start_codon:yes stop_codon:yes gene_type:complete